MNINNISISLNFYNQPNICKNISHKIDFLNTYDKYNPFSNINLQLSSNMTIDENTYLKIIELIVSHDLEDPWSCAFMEKSNAIAKTLFPLFKSEIEKHGIEFNKNKIKTCKNKNKAIYTNIYAKMTFATPDSTISIMFELLS